MILEPSKSQPSRAEFVALMAMLMATIAFSIDAMLPALTEMGQELSPENPVRVQLVVILFMAGMGVGTLFTGPLSDAYGRRPVIFASGALYALGALLAWRAPSLDLILAARVIQGFGASGARVVSMAMVRDRFSGRAMAQVTSMIITVFMLVPAIAPTLGAGIIGLGGWRLIFLSFLGIIAIALTWLALRQPETLRLEDRRPVRVGLIRRALVDIAAIPMVRRSILAMSLCFAMMMTNISSTEMVFEQTFGLGHQFPFWFGAAALASLIAPFANSRFVMRFGMYSIACWALLAEAALSGLYLLGLETGMVAETAFAPYFLWQVSIFMTMGLSMGNLNAMVMEPLGHVAGIASSLMTALSTIIGAALAIPASAAFDGTQIPLVLSIFLFTATARVLLNGRAFRSPEEPVPAE